MNGVVIAFAAGTTIATVSAQLFPRQDLWWGVGGSWVAVLISLFIL